MINPPDHFFYPPCDLGYLLFLFFLFFVLQSNSEEFLPLKRQSQSVRNMKIPKPIVKKMCAATYTFGIQACIDIRSRNAIFLKKTPIYAIIGNHTLMVNVTPGK